MEVDEFIVVVYGYYRFEVLFYEDKIIECVLVICVEEELIEEVMNEMDVM